MSTSTRRSSSRGDPRARGDLDDAARAIVAEAYRRGSTGQPDRADRVGRRPAGGSGGLHQQLARLAPPPLLEARAEIDGYRIVREIHAPARSHSTWPRISTTGGRVVLKTPRIDLQARPGALERFMLEEWIARRAEQPARAEAHPRTRERPLPLRRDGIRGGPDARAVDDRQPAARSRDRARHRRADRRGLQAFHRMEMLHQDLRPENIMIDRTGTVKIIDFGSVSVAGVDGQSSRILGTFQYAAPEYFVGDGGSERADFYSLGVIAYQMLSGRLPYGAEAARVRTRAAQRRLQY
jgi:hypothetical protein